jgi:hypothetical protein
MVAIVTAVSFGLAAPAFAQTAPAVGSSQPAQSQSSQPLLLDGQNAMAQQVCDPNLDPNCNSNTGLYVAAGVGLAIGGIIWAISANKKNSVSP